MNITPLKVTVREVVTGYVDDSDREEGIYGYSGRLNIRPKYQRNYIYDDAKIAKLLNPPLTTIRQPVKLLAETAVASLLQRIRNPGLAPRAILLDTQMVVRSST